jgi:hypothetical protein
MGKRKAAWSRKSTKKRKTRSARSRAYKSRSRRLSRAVPFGGRRELKQTATVGVITHALSVTPGLSTNIFSTGPYVQPLGLIGVGDDNSTRDGRAVYMKSAHVRCVISGADGTTTRVLMFVDKRNNSSAGFKLTDMFATTGVHQPFDPDKTGRYTILSDVALTHANLSSGLKFMDIFLDRSINRSIKYTGVNPIIGHVDNNQVYLMIMNDGPSGAGAFVVPKANSTWCRFTDS